jgi:malonyl-CoA O-methyltransferase
MAIGAQSKARPLDAAALARVNRRLQSAPQAPWLHAEVARRLAARLALIRMQPRTVLDWGAFAGASRDLLERAYPQSTLIAVEPDIDRRAATAAALARPWWSPRRLGRGAPPVLLPGEVAERQGELLWANMSLHWAIDPLEEFRLWHRALAVDGFLMFSTLGPGSLQALRELYESQHWAVPHAPFVDMHDLGDMLVEAGFAGPVMDQETVTLTWTSGTALLAELRRLGGNVDPRRQRGLRTPRWHRRLAALLDARADAGGRVALGFEIVYGHAFRPPPRPRLAAETSLPLDDLRAMARARRPRG